MVLDGEHQSVFLRRKSCQWPSLLNQWLRNSPREFPDHIWSRQLPQPLTFWS